ncbi:hypothetical protein [Fodinicurvata sediminis]|uniref:hypothetical protein n=1 Tax=Fodinicurvata sediminis TaxID=1121832 RepID=UPI0003B5DA6A|nr:hypothetical protein [Fodinicurvata sediminis]
MMGLLRSILFSLVVLVSDLAGFGLADDLQAPSQQSATVEIAENTPRFSSQSYSRIRTTIRGEDGKSVPVEVSVRLQSQGGDEALLTLVRDGAPGDLILALPDTRLGPEDLRTLIIQDGAESALHYTTVGALRAGNHGRGLTLQHQEIDDSTPALLLRRSGRDRLEARLHLRDTARLGRILVTLGGASGWTSV